MLRDVFGFKCVDAERAGLIFALLSAELGVPPVDSPDGTEAGRHSVSFMCDDLVATIANRKSKTRPQDRGWGHPLQPTKKHRGATLRAQSEKFEVKCERAAPSQHAASKKGRAT